MEGKMNCEEYKNLITISVFGELTQEELTQLKAHLRDCPECAATYERSEKLSELSDQKENIPVPDKEKSWQIIAAKALKQKRGWLDRFVVQKPVFQYAAVLLLIVVGFSAGYFYRSAGLKGSQLAQLQEEVSQIREITAASLLRQESLNMKLREIGMSTPLVRSEERPLGYLFRTLVAGTEEEVISAQPKQTSPLVDLALTLVRHINQSDVY
jgi:hypothetical protein